VYLDHKIGELLKTLPEDVTVLVVSDHGVQDMRGGVCVNEWLLDNGWLVLEGERPTEPTSLKKLKVDWPKTRAWAEGGHYGRISLNVKGREPQGTIDQADYEAVRGELAGELVGITDADGNALGTRVVRPSDVYSATTGIAPDLMAYFGDLAWRSVGTIGHGAHTIPENDTGFDDANHHPDGVFIMAGPGTPGVGKRVEGLRIYDVAPTVLKLFDQDIPVDMLGSVVSD
jgi:predicted AlkP superfamily phosphohydrolase/phosphomutase